MLREERRDYLLNKNQKLIARLNELVGSGHDKVMSQRELAIILNCSNSTIARWLRGETPISIEFASKVCDILGLDKSEYLEFEDLILEKKPSNFQKLSEQNQQKVYEYIDYLLYLQGKQESDTGKNFVLKN